MAVIPARLDSSRVPGKPLIDVGGIPLVERVRERVLRAHRVDEVWVATDDERIATLVRARGGHAVVTGPAASGTHRVAQVARDLDAAFVLNVQCDQPDLDPDHVDALVDLLAAGAEVATLATPLDAGADPSDPAAVKVVCDGAGHALYFSRAAIPHGGPWWRHLGLYGFTRGALSRCAAAPATGLERSEDLEQLRWLSAGVRVRVGRVPHAAAALDTLSHLRSWIATPPRTP